MHCVIIYKNKILFVLTIINRIIPLILKDILNKSHLKVYMEKFYTKEFILAFLYNEMPFALRRQFVMRLQKDPLLRRMYYDLKAAVDSLKNLTTIRPSEKLINYIKSYASQSMEGNARLGFSNN